MEINELVRRLGNASEKVGKIVKKIAKWESKINSEKEFKKEYDWLNNFEERKEYYKEQWINHCMIEIRRTQNELKEAQKLVEKYESLISYEQNKQVEEVPVIREFLENWANSFLTWAKELRKEYYARNSEYCKLWNSRQLTKDQELEYKEYCSYLPRYIKDGTDLETMVAKEKKAKYEMLVNRCKEVIGAIVDAKALKISGNGELNGFIDGSNGRCKIETIGAGGYNIQCFHFRVLVKKVS